MHLASIPVLRLSWLRRSLVVPVLAGSALAFAGSPAKPNILFIGVDDLNHWVGHVGRNPQTKTPHIDRLAKMGVTFTRANCAAPVCNPSRAALMSGLRASTTGIYDNGQDWKPVIPTARTLTTQFLQAGYNVYGAGKIYHGGHREGEWTDYFNRDGTPLKLHPSAKDDGVGGIKWTNLARNPAHAAVKAELAQFFPRVNTPELPRTRSNDERQTAAKAKGTKRKQNQD